MNTYHVYTVCKFCASVIEHGNVIEIHNGIMFNFYLKIHMHAGILPKFTLTYSAYSNYD